MKIKQDSELIGCRIGVNNISDNVMEGYHPHGKQGKFLFSGGKGGPTGKIAYQKNVLSHQFQNEWSRHEKQEKMSQISNNARGQLDFADKENGTKKVHRVWWTYFLKISKRLSTIHSDV